MKLKREEEKVGIIPDVIYDDDTNRRVVICYDLTLTDIIVSAPDMLKFILSFQRLYKSYLDGKILQVDLLAELYNLYYRAEDIENKITGD